MKVGDKLFVKIKTYGIFGEGVAEYENTVIFVSFAMKDEVCKISISDIKKNFAFGRVVEVVEHSPERVLPPCPYYFSCGGCDLLHMTYDESISLKLSSLAFTLTKMLHRPLTFAQVERSDKVFNYRNKAVFQCKKIDKKWVVGMYEEESNTLSEIESCCIQDENINVCLKIFKEFLNFHPESFENNKLKYFVVRTIKSQVLVTIVCENHNINNLEILCSSLSKKFKKIGVWLNINKSKTSLILSDDFIHLFGAKTIKCNSMGIKQEIGPCSFLQVNNYIKEKIYKEILKNIDEKSVLIDAYGGTGHLSALCAKKCDFVYSVEIDKEATISANDLCKNNSIQNQLNINGDCSVVFPKLAKTIETKNLTIIIDPPRKGATVSVLDSILKMSPDKIIYLSCNPATLARDVEFLTRNNLYGISVVKPFDMFPCTHHLETLLILIKQQNS